MRRYRFLHADVFTEMVFGGNPLAVFPKAEGLTDAEMQQIAREMNLSETAFVLPPTNSHADVQVRFFTPSTELPLAGHPTIGTHVVLAAVGHYEITGPVTRIFQQTKVGVLPVDLITDGAGRTDRAVMTQDEARHGGIFEDAGRMADALGLHTDELHPELPMQVYSTGVPQLMTPVTSLQALQRITPNPGLISEICREMGATAIHAFSLETLDAAHHVHVRHFAPLIGILEDPATGSAAGALGAYLLGKQVFDYLPTSTTHMVMEQGYCINRPSLIEVEVDVTDGHVSEVRVGGQVVILIEGELRLS